MALSLAEQVARLPENEREEVLNELDPATLLWAWDFWGRPEQHAPTGVDWAIWLFMAGRGAGKSRSASEWIRDKARYTNQGELRMGLVARTAADVRDVLVEGESGILNVCPPSEKPEYQPSKRKLTWPNGNTALCFCATPDTEALTRDRGWVTHDALHEGDLILTFNTSTGLSEWQPVMGVHRFDVVDEPLAEITGRFHSSRTTMNHRWPVWDREGRVRWTTTGDIVEGRAGTKSRIIGSAPCADLPTAAKYSDAFVELAAWFMCEGTVSKVGHHPSVSISQSLTVNPGHCANIERALHELFGPPRDHLVKTGKRITGLSWRKVSAARGRTVQAYHLDPDAAAEVLSVFDSPRWEKVPTREFILSLTRAQLELFVARCVDADGYVKNENGTNYSLGQNHPERDDRFALALTLLGRPYSQFYTEKPYKGEPYPFWATSVRRSPGIPLVPRVRDAITVEGYTGVVWCPTVENSTWFARRDGKTYFTGNTADEPDSLRGPNFHYVWGDEVAAWRQMPDAAGMTAFDNMRVATRLGPNPQICLTTTPKRVQLMRKLLKEAEDTGRVRVTRGRTMDNRGNLSGAYLEGIMGVYGGTRMALQELDGEMLDDVEGALWNQEILDQFRTTVISLGLPIKCVGVDPTVAERPGDECGIIVCAATNEREMYRRQAWVLEDATIHGSPETWAQRVVDTARKWGAPVVAEVNQGGALVRNAINAIDPGIPVYEVHSKHGKALRAEPVALGYEQGRVHHMGFLAELETQMVSWIPGEGRSPDRIDALVHALTALMIKAPQGFGSGPIRAKSPASRRLPSGRGAGAVAASRRGGRVINPGRRVA